MKHILGLDIGGANLKSAHTRGTAQTVPFALWKHPDHLPAALAALVASAPPFDAVAVTMTGELCDCYETKQEGVDAIVDAVAAACPGHCTSVWRNDGLFVDVADARQSAYQVAAANWLALATWASRLAPEGPALLVDIGSTTTDIIPLLDGQPVPHGRTDADRLLSGELVYRGVRRTPLWTLDQPIAAELFATVFDAFLVEGLQPEDAADTATADGRPATRAFAHARLARMLGSDGATCPQVATQQLARQAIAGLSQAIADGLARVIRRMPAPPATVILSGSGEFFAQRLLEGGVLQLAPQRLSLTTQLGEQLSQAACAYAVAVLAAEHTDGG